MTYRETPPPPRLRGLAECLWTIRPDGAAARSVLPDGCMDLVWTGTALVLAGPDTVPHRAAGSTLPSAGVRFAAGRLPAVLGVPASTVRDQRVELAELRPQARGAVARLESGADPAAVLSALAVDLVTGAPDLAADLRWLGPVIAGTRAGASAAEVADAVGWTSRTLHRRCLAAFGYGPATLRRVLRFRAAVQLLQTGVPIAAAAADAGYADQPHLSREVRALAGVAPGQLASGANRSTPVPSGSRTVA